MNKKISGFLIFILVLYLSAQLFAKPTNLRIAQEDIQAIQATNNYNTQCNKIDNTAYNGLTYSGYLNIGIKDSTSALGFIFHGAKGKSVSEIKSIPTIFWLGGGPGCSSQYGTFIENGPLSIDLNESGKFEFKENPNAWTNKYNVMYIDQPVGTGISHIDESNTEYPTSMETVVKHFYFALTELYENTNGCFNQFGLTGKTSPMFIYGESYAGKYIPAISDEIVKQGNKFNLSGIGISDGITSPIRTVESLNQFALDQGMITQEIFEQSKEYYKASQEYQIQNKFLESLAIFYELLSFVNPNKVDQYKITQMPSTETSTFINYLNAEGKDFYKLHFTKDIQECSPEIKNSMNIDIMRETTVKNVEYLLSQGIFVHVFNGDLDLIVPYYSPQLWISTLNWDNIQSYLQSDNKILRINKNPVATSRQYKNLMYNTVFESGHMVPEDQPETMNLILDNAIQLALKMKQN